MVVKAIARVPLKMRKHLLVATFLSYALVVAGCGNGSTGRAAAPERPQNVPANAIWVGGADGGAFVVVEKQRGAKPHLYYGEIYYESGGLWYKGRLALEPATAPFPDPKQANLLSAWDGDALHLGDGRLLRAIEVRERKSGKSATQ